MTRYQKRNRNNAAKMVIYFLVLAILCACIVGLWFRQKERQANFREMVIQASQMETGYQLQRYGNDEAPEKAEETQNETDAESE